MSDEQAHPRCRKTRKIGNLFHGQTLPFHSHNQTDTNMHITEDYESTPAFAYANGQKVWKNS